MSKSYYIQLTMLCGQELHCFASFNLGSDGKFASQLFHRLQGNRNAGEHHPLKVEFIEMKYQLPLSLDIIGCSLADIGENVKLITRELFARKLLSG